MNWSRYKVLLITGGLMLALTGGSLFIWMKAGAANAGLAQDIKQLQKERDQLTNLNPFPSEQSAEVLKEEQDKVAELRDPLVEHIREGQITPPRVVRSMFVDYVRGLIPQLKELATTSTLGGEQGVLLRDAEFGLSDYSLRGDIPEASRLKSLVLEIEIMSHLSQILFTSGISELVSIEVVESTDQPEPRRRTGLLGGGQPGLGGGRLSRNEGKEEEVDPAEEQRKNVQKQIERMFTPMVVDLKFNVYEDLFWQVLNQIVKDPNQIVIRHIKITNGNEALWPQSISRPFGAEAGRVAPPSSRSERRSRNDLVAMLENPNNGEASAQDAGVSVPIAGLTDRRQRTTGGELLHVSMQVAFYRLNAESTTPEEN